MATYKIQNTKKKEKCHKDSSLESKTPYSERLPSYIINIALRNLSEISRVSSKVSKGYRKRRKFFMYIKTWNKFVIFGGLPLTGAHAGLLIQDY